jgi:DNA-binding CsgD family transcriptional regulator
MTELLPQDYDLLLSLIGELHAFRNRADLCHWLLDKALPALLPSDWLSYNEVDLLSPAKTQSILKPESASFFRDLFPRFRELTYQHPLIIHQMQSANFPVHKISDFLSQKDYHQLELYQDVYKPMGVEYQMAVTIRLSTSHVIAFALSRKEYDYSERDRSILELLRPHLVVAFNTLELIEGQAAALDGTELALNELSSATLIVDLHGHILFHTGPGREWVGATKTRQLPKKIFDWLDRCFMTGARDSLSWFSDAGEFEIRAVPMTSSERRLLVLTRKGSDAADGLSRRQREVARWIREGKTNQEIAAIMGISPRTVQKHVEHIFEKLGVETRVAIATKMV